MSRTRSPARSPSRSKSTVSTGRPLPRAVPTWLVADRLLVRLGGRDRNGPPAEALENPPAARGAHPRPALGVVEEVGQRGVELFHVPGGDQVSALAVRA